MTDMATLRKLFDAALKDNTDYFTGKTPKRAVPATASAIHRPLTVAAWADVRTVSRPAPPANAGLGNC
jgi:hypothetical protein